MAFKTAVLGASGYAGGELVRLIDGHDQFQLFHLGAHSHEGGRLGDVHPHLDGGQRSLGAIDVAAVAEADLVFLALPHGASTEIGAELRARHVMVVDLGSDYRLDTPERYSSAYEGDHPHPEALGEWSYGLCELFDLKGSRAIASPGCYPTSVLLALGPLLAGGLVDPTGIVADCLSGVTGAGRSVTPELTFGAVDEGVRAYNVARHRHRPEIEMALDQLVGGEHRLVFTPHLVPMQRGILATVTCRSGASEQECREALGDAYSRSPFVDVIDRPPQTRWVVGSNRALVTAFVDSRTGSIIAQCAIDNLLKGAAGQAVQAANIALGLDETLGLPVSGWMP